MTSKTYLQVPHPVLLLGALALLALTFPLAVSDMLMSLMYHARALLKSLGVNRIEGSLGGFKRPAKKMELCPGRVRRSQ